MPHLLRELAGRTALVTGAGAGIGAATARRLAAMGARVWVTDIDGAAAEFVATEIRDLGDDAVAATLDVTSHAACADFLAQRDKDTHGLDILVNNAGINIRSDLRHLKPDDWECIRSINLDAVMQLSLAAQPLLTRTVEARRADASDQSGAAASSIVNIASIMAAHPVRQLGSYATTKGAVMSLTKALAVEWATLNVRVNAVAPGFIATDMTDRYLKHPAFSSALIQRTPMGRFGTPEDVADAVGFLASERARYITGTVLTVDGGMTAGV